MTPIRHETEGQVAPIDKDDAAAAAAAVLTSDGHDGETYDLTGPNWAPSVSSPRRPVS